VDNDRIFKEEIREISASWRGRILNFVKAIVAKLTLLGWNYVNIVGLTRKTMKPRPCELEIAVAKSRRKKSEERIFALLL
jgi:hypothetical protein